MSFGGRYARGTSTVEMSNEGRMYPSLLVRTPFPVMALRRAFASVGVIHFCPSDTPMTNSSAVATSFPIVRKNAAAHISSSPVMASPNPSAEITVVVPRALSYIRACVVCGLY